MRIQSPLPATHFHTDSRFQCYYCPLSTSPGQSGAQSVLAAAQASAPYFSANLIGAISLPNFFDNFDIEKEIVTDDTFKQNLLSSIDKLSIR